ncbi:hypothetical protein COT30_02950, partial [Candidatus Micrarchaeota archaeon CG08_land_8_20_14_0_20_49_17]
QVDFMRKHIYIAFLGFDSNRIYQPYKMCKCDKAYIIKREERDKPTAEWNLSKIMDALSGEEIIPMIVEHDIFSRINCVKRIFEKEKENRIFVNLSTGSKLDCIAGMLAVMLFHKIPKEVIPFYAEPEKSGRKTSKSIKFSETIGVRNIKELPIMDIDYPDAPMLEALKIINGNRGEIKKKQLVLELCQRKQVAGYELDIGAKRDKRKKRIAMSGAMHAAENRIIRPLKIKWKAITEEDKPKNRRISLTANGEKLVKIFFGN